MATNVNWRKFGNGYLAIDHRPKISRIKELKSSGCGCIVTLLSEKEDAKRIGATTKSSGMQWLWFPLANGNPLGKKDVPAAKQLYKQMKCLLEKEKKIFVHCSAGIHRTGMIVYGFLRYMKIKKERARVMLRELRKITGEGAGEHRLLWADRFFNN